MIDNREQKIVFKDVAEIARLCDRRFGIGSDGLILLEPSGLYDFRMKYYNADGQEGSMCGNGGRCIVSFAGFLGITKEEAIDGLHKAYITGRHEDYDEISLDMLDVKNIRSGENYFIMDTGSPHYVTKAVNLEALDVVYEGKKIRNSEPFIKEGINVNFISGSNNQLNIRTYERGVEDETYSCGTGSVAAAISLFLQGLAVDSFPVDVYTRGGKLKVSFKAHNNEFTGVKLIGPAVRVFEGWFDKKHL